MAKKKTATQLLRALPAGAQTVVTTAIVERLLWWVETTEFEDSEATDAYLALLESLQFLNAYPARSPTLAGASASDRTAALDYLKQAEELVRPLLPD